MPLRKNVMAKPSPPHRRLWTIIAIVEVLLLALCVRELWRLPDGKLHVHFLDVGQGDSALIVTPSGKQIVIDGGPNNRTVEELGRLMPLTDRTLDLLVLTHPDQDHIFAFPEILRRYQVSSVLLTGIDKESSKYKEILRLLKEQHIPLLIADPKKDIDLGDGAVLDVLWPRPVWVGKLTTKANDSGIVLRLLYGTRSVVFPADVEKPSEVAILSSGEELRGDILKAAHHGSRTSSSTGFLLAVDPSLGIFSAPIISPYGHPHPDVVARYKAFGIETRQTGREGTISVTLDRN